MRSKQGGDRGSVRARLSAALALAALTLLAALAALPSEPVLGDGTGSPAACNTPYNDGSAPFSWTAPSGWLITGVCIKAGSTHSNVYTSNGTVGSPFASGCYSISGVGTQNLSVTKVGAGPTCQDVSHIDVVKSRVFKVKKVIDLDGNLNTTNDQINSGPLVSGWTFTVTNVEGGTVSPSSDTTDSTGEAGPFYFVNNDDAHDEVDILEAEKDGYDFFAASCSFKEFDLDVSGSQVGVRNLDVFNTGDLICTFYNKPTTGTIIIVKDAQPNSAQDFGFTGDFGPFSLDDDADGTLPNSRTFGNLAAGTYSVAETPAEGWDLTGATCSDQSDPASISLQAGETVTCTFVNKKKPTITVIKEVVGGDAEPDDFDLTADGEPVDSGDTNVVEPGTHTIGETLQEGYFFGGVEGEGCPEDLDGEGAELEGDTAELDYGDAITCTITNVAFGSITIVKQTNPASEAQDFGFTGDFGGFTLDTDGVDGTYPDEVTFDELQPGTYSVSENAVAGWDLTSATCDDSSEPASISLQAGEHVTCTFVNERLPHLTLVKEVLDGDCDYEQLDFNLVAYLTEEGTPVGQPVLQGACGDAGEVDPSTYYLSESPMEGYTNVGGYTCIDGETGDPVEAPAGQVTLGYGDSVTCTIVNRALDPADPQVEKILDPADEDLLDGSVNAGDTFAYVITVTNEGEDASEFLRLYDDLDGAELVSIESDDGAFDCEGTPGSFPCDIGELDGGESVTFVVTVQANEDCEDITNVATLVQVTGEGEEENEVDPSEAPVVNVEGCEISINVTKEQRIDEAEFADEMFSFTGGSISELTEGDEVWFRLTLVNTGDTPIDWELVDDLPGELEFISFISNPDDACSESGDTIECSGEDLEPGDSFTVTFAVRVDTDDCDDFIVNDVDGEGRNGDNTVTDSDSVRMDLIECVEETPTPTPTLTPTLTPTATSQVGGTLTSETLPASLPRVGSDGGDASGGGTLVGFGLIGLAFLASALFFLRQTLPRGS